MEQLSFLSARCSGECTAIRIGRNQIAAYRRRQEELVLLGLVEGRDSEERLVAIEALGAKIEEITTTCESLMTDCPGLGPLDAALGSAAIEVCRSPALRRVDDDQYDETE